MLSFLENALKLDASGLNIGGGGQLIATLTLDQRSSIAISTFTVTVPPNEDASTPFSVTLVKTSSQLCTLTITFNQPIQNVRFGKNRTLLITANNSETFNLDIEINYTNSFSSSNWSNASAITDLDDIDFKGPLTSASLNNRLLALLHSAITSANQIKNIFKYYSFKEKYLSDIIDFAISAGSSLEPSTSIITNNSNGDITSIIINYNTGRNRTEKIKITYTYGDYTIKRLRKRNSTYTELTTEMISLLNSFRVDAIDNSENIIYNLGVITINRSADYTIYNIPYLKEYNATLPPETIDIDPDNLLSDYKYYKTYTITGWTVVA